MIYAYPFWTGLLVGLLLGAGALGHALRLVTLWPFKLKDFGTFNRATARLHVAWSACWIYTIAAALVAATHPLGHMIAIAGPIIGLSSVLLFGLKVDAFQITMGVGQFTALAIAVVLLVIQ